MKKSNRSRSRKKKRQMLPAKVRLMLILIAAVSAFQLLKKGELTWPIDLYNATSETLRKYAARPDAAWRKAASALEGLGATREGQHNTDFDLRGRVVRVADGDTLSILENSGQQHTIRLFGIDAPERDQAYGKASRNALSAMVDGKTVAATVAETDDYGRTVATIYQGSTNVNLAMVNGGHAWWYRRYAAYERHLAEAEKVARRERRGLWADPQAKPPWEWRRNYRD